MTQTAEQAPQETELYAFAMQIFEIYRHDPAISTNPHGGCGDGSGNFSCCVFQILFGCGVGGVDEQAI